MNKLELAEKFDELARLLEISRENPFKVRSYRFAVRVIGEHKNSDLTEEDIKDLKNIRGIGDAIVNKSIEYFQTGKIARLEEIKESIPENILKLALETKLGSKVISSIWKDYGIVKKEEILSFAWRYKDSLKLKDSQLKRLESLFKK